MPDVTHPSSTLRAGAPIGSGQRPLIPVFAFGMSLGTFFAFTFTICVGFDLLFPGMAMYETWLKLLPGFTWLSWPSFFLGLAESVAYGWYVALVFGPLFNFFSGAVVKMITRIPLKSNSANKAIDSWLTCSHERISQMSSFLKSSTGALVLSVFASTTALAATVYIPEGSAGSVLIVEAETGDVIKRISGLEAIHGLSGAPGVRYMVAGSFQELSREDAAQTDKPAAVSAEDHEAHHAGSDNRNPASDGTVSIVTILDTQTEEIVHRLEVPAAVHHTAVSPDGSLAVATHPGDDGISIIDLETMKVVGFVATGPTPNYAAFSSDSQRVFVTNTGNATVSEVDVAKLVVTRNMIVGDAPEHFVATSDDSALFVLDSDVGNVFEVSTASGKVSRTFGIGGELHGIDLAEDEKTLFVSAKGSNQLVAINLSTGDTRSVPLLPAPYHVATVAGTGKVYVSSRDMPKVWVVDQKTLSVSKEIPISGEGHQMVVVP